MNYTPDWNLATIPDPEFRSERSRRASLLRRTHGAGPGRPRKPTACPRCGYECPSARQAVRHCAGRGVTTAG